MAITELDKIRKAEEIYYRRNGIKPENSNNKKNSLIGGIIKRLIIVTVIIGGVYAYQNKEYVMSEQFKTDLKNILNTEINLKEIWSDRKENDDEKTEENTDKEIPEAVKESSKAVFTYIKPIEGEITSYFGYRESSNPNVEGYHTGIDIAGNIGDKIVASSYGKVIEVSSERWIWKSFKNRKWKCNYVICTSSEICMFLKVILFLKDRK